MIIFGRLHKLIIPYRMFLSHGRISACSLCKRTRSLNIWRLPGFIVFTVNSAWHILKLKSHFFTFENCWNIFWGYIRLKRQLSTKYFQQTVILVKPFFGIYFYVITQPQEAMGTCSIHHNLTEIIHMHPRLHERCLDALCIRKSCPLSSGESIKHIENCVTLCVGLSPRRHWFESRTLCEILRRQSGMGQDFLPVFPFTTSAHILWARH